MKITEHNVDLPDELIAALTENKLVIFLGAGISARAYPQQKKNTYYPLFKDLCKQIADELSINMYDLNYEYLFKNGFYDQLLGVWKDDNKKVHELTSNILTRNEKRQRLNLHKAIISLFPKGSDLRIVTTNFDNLLHNAVNQIDYYKNSNFTTYYASALPTAKRFKGICYLHGNVNNPEEMILTDKDIGRVYMEEGWALKFAHDLFRELAVLFIGYSLNDPPLRYLTLALEATRELDTDSNFLNKWALIPNDRNIEETVKDWKRRGVGPIVFPSKYKNYKSLEIIICEWAKDNNSSFIDRKNILLKLTRGKPNELLTYELDRVRFYLSIPELLREFAKSKFDPSWFDFLMDYNYLQPLFLKNSQLNEAEMYLSKKIIDYLLNDSTQWILRLQKFRKSINQSILIEFIRRTSELKKKSETELRRLFEFFRPLFESTPAENYASSLDDFFSMLSDHNVDDILIWLHLSLLEFDIKIKESFSNIMDEIEGKSIRNLELESEADFNGQILDYQFKEIFKKYIKPRLSIMGYHYLIKLSTKLEDILFYLDCIKPVKYTYIHRSKIDPEEKQSYKTPIDIIIDILIECWEDQLKSDMAKAAIIYSIWKDAHNVYFKRLALFALRRLLENNYVE